MHDQLQPVKTKEEFAHVLEKLAALSRDLLLAFRLEVGQLMLDHYFGGSAHAFRDQSPSKVLSFQEFCKVCQDDLADLGLTATVLRHCILARIAWDGLPPQVRAQLRFSHVVALASVAEPNMRARLAYDATAQHWNVSALKDAIARVGDGSYYDTDPVAPGTQPPLAKPSVAKAYQPGRLVNQLVKAGQDLQAWRQAWATVDASKLRGPQRERCVGALAALKADIAQLEAELAGKWRGV